MKEIGSWYLILKVDEVKEVEEEDLAARGWRWSVAGWWFPLICVLCDVVQSLHLFNHFFLLFSSRRVLSRPWPRGVRVRSGAAVYGLGSGVYRLWFSPEGLAVYCWIAPLFLSYCHKGTVKDGVQKVAYCLLSCLIFSLF